ncbi:MAG: hypothetical protein WCA15_01670 [Candidatus Acidiferrales bacterium]
MNNRDNSQILSIAVIEIHGYILRKFTGAIQRPNANKVAQDSDMVEGPSGVLSAAHIRLIALVGDRDQDVRESLWERGRRRAGLDVQHNLLAIETDRRKAYRYLFGPACFFDRLDRPFLVATYELDTPVHDHLWRIDARQAKLACVSALPVAVFAGREGILPSDIVPVVYVFAKNDQVGAAYGLRSV